MAHFVVKFLEVSFKIGLGGAMVVRVKGLTGERMPTITMWSDFFLPKENIQPKTCKSGNEEESLCEG